MLTLNECHAQECIAAFPDKTHLDLAPRQHFDAYTRALISISGYQRSRIQEQYAYYKREARGWRARLTAAAQRSAAQRTVPRTAASANTSPVASPHHGGLARAVVDNGVSRSWSMVLPALMRRSTHLSEPGAARRDTRSVCLSHKALPCGRHIVRYSSLAKVN